MKHPLVSIIIPAYNAAQFIGQTLESILADTYTSIEIIVVNDGSKDDTQKIVASYAAKDSRITIINQNNGGVCRARNHGIEKSKGKYILPVDADRHFVDKVLEDQALWKLSHQLLAGTCKVWRHFPIEPNCVFP